MAEVDGDVLFRHRAVKRIDAGVGNADEALVPDVGAADGRAVGVGEAVGERAARFVRLRVLGAEPLGAGVAGDFEVVGFAGEGVEVEGEGARAEIHRA